MDKVCSNYILGTKEDVICINGIKKEDDIDLSENVYSEKKTSEIENDPTVYHCNLCEEMYPTEELLKHHIQGFHCFTSADKDNQDELLDSEKDEEDKHGTEMESVPVKLNKCKDEYCETEQIFQCGQCVQHFKSLFDLKHHSKTHTSGRSFKCDICSKEFKLKSDFDIHAQTHMDGELPPKYEICSKKFPRKEVLKIEWPREAVILLVEHWQKFECLYNPKISTYSNKHARRAALVNIADKLKANNFNIDANDVKNKINTLRGQFVRELYKKKDSYKNGAGTSDSYEPTPYWFPHLNFLEGFTKLRKGQSTLPRESLSDLGDDSASLEGSPLAKKVKLHIDSPVSSHTDDLLKVATDAVKTVTKPEMRGNEGLLSYLKSMMDEVTDDDLKDDLEQQLVSLLWAFRKKQKERNCVKP